MTASSAQTSSRWLQLARSIGPEQYEEACSRYASFRNHGQRTFEAAVLSAIAFPPSGGLFADAPELLAFCNGPDLRSSLDKQACISRLRENWNLSGLEEAKRSLRRFARQQKLRIALREILPTTEGGAEFRVAARELSELAEATIEIALERAVAEVSRRFGRAERGDGRAGTFCVLGMGKLGGLELNAGSDVDLIYAYDTDEGCARTSDGEETLSNHDYWSRVGRTLTSILGDVTEDGFVWRVDLRLRPEGRSGAIANSESAMLHYYETWGRLWERTAFIRARCVAGDMALGQSILDELSAFVYRKRVDPSIADDLMQLSEQARAQIAGNGGLHLKLEQGGIRDIELFTQSLQLIWGGVDKSLRVRGTEEALVRLRSAGLVTDGEARGLIDGYTTLRKAEHVVQYATEVQTHVLPEDPQERAGIGRRIGYTNLDTFDNDIASAMSHTRSCVTSLSQGDKPKSHTARVLAALDLGDAASLEQALAAHIADRASPELAQDLMALTDGPGSLLSAQIRQEHPGHAEVVIDAILDAAEPETAARSLRAFFSRSQTPSVYVSMLSSNPRASRRFINVLGASAFVAGAVIQKPELGDQVLFSKGMPSPERARAEIAREIGAALAEQGMQDEVEAFTGALRRAKMKITLETALADLSGEVDARAPSITLSELADGSIEASLRKAMGEAETTDGFCVIAVGKLGGRELGYASDLDLLFIFDPERQREGHDAIQRLVRTAQRTMRYLSMPHADGPGYELDTRLRPSGSQGVLVASLPSFARYHGQKLDGASGASHAQTAASWERQTLVRARPCAGDLELAQRVMRIAHAAAYEVGAPEAAETHRLRMRLQQELSKEGGQRYNLKLGRGGLSDIEFAVQTLQMRHGRDHRVRKQGTLDALFALQEGGHLDSESVEVLKNGYEFLRRLEQRLHVVHANPIHLIECNAPGLIPLARRMGFRNQAGKTAQELLMTRYREITQAVRATYLRVLGIDEE